LSYGGAGRLYIGRGLGNWGGLEVVFHSAIISTFGGS